MGNIAIEGGARLRFGRFVPAVVLLTLAFSLPALPAFAQPGQDDIDEAPSARIAQIPGPATAELNAALSRLARDPRNVSALVNAGQAALRMGDTQAALGFFTRADQVSPNNARIKMQIGSALVLANEPADAIKYFDAAESANGDLTSFALDRGLAYDLLGDNRQAQGWYQVALSHGVNAQATLRYAISLAISHDLKTSEALLSPLIQKQDRAAWRARTFALAINGDETQAVSISRAMMPAGLAEGIAPYLRYMPRLTRPQQAAAANLGRFPRAADIGHDDSKIMAYAAAHPEIGHGLVPVGAPLGAVATKDDSRISRAKRRVPGRDNSDVARAPVALAGTSRSSGDIDGDLAQSAPMPDAKRGKDRRTDRGKPARPSLALATNAQATAPLPAYTAPPPSSVPSPTVRSVLDGPAVRGSAPLPSNPALSPRPVPGLVPTPVLVPRPTLPRQATVIFKPAPARSADNRNGTAAGAIASAPTPVVRATIKPAPLLATAPSQAVVAATIPAPRPALVTSSGPSATSAALVPGPARLSSMASVALPASTAAATNVSGTAPVLRPAAGTNFDLAQLDTSRVLAGSAASASTAAPAMPRGALVPSPSPSSTAAPAVIAPAATDFGSAFGGFTPSPTERQDAVAAVDLSQIKPVRRRPVKAADVIAVAEEPLPTTAKSKARAKARLKARGARIDGPPDGPVASRSGDEDVEPVTVVRGAKLGPKARKAALEAEAEAKKVATNGKAGKRGVLANPSRIWVQLLTAPNRDAFPREWVRITKQAPAIFRGKRGWVTPWGRNYRLLMGPYASDDDAQDALNDLTKAKVRAFVWTSPAGQAVDHLGNEG